MKISKKTKKELLDDFDESLNSISQMLAIVALLGMGVVAILIRLLYDLFFT